MLKTVEISKLFERFDYSLDFSRSRMTIITGPNGFGKTTILRIIRDVLDDDLFDLYKIPFEGIDLKTDDGKVLSFVKKNNELFLNDVKIFIPSYIGESNQNNIVFTLNESDLKLLQKEYKKFIFPQQTLNVLFVEHSDPNVALRTEDYVARINSQITGNHALKFVDDLLNFYDSVGNTIFCGADRLYRDYLINDGGRNKKKFNEVISLLSMKLDSLFNYYNGEYTSLSNVLDYSFIPLLISQIEKSSEEATYTEEQYVSDSKMIKEQLDKLFHYGFLLKDNFYPDDSIFKKEYALVFKVFIDNYKKKIASLEQLIDKLDLFIGIVNSKLIHKKIEVRKDKDRNHIIVKDGNKVIQLQNLSSGEQEIIVLYFKLVFEIQDKLIALIDEPELSSHVSWQYEMLDDFEKILSVNKNISQMIVCTHSPQIINEKWDQTIDLFDFSEESNE